jgi:signal transduction histidine kinase
LQCPPAVNVKDDFMRLDVISRYDILHTSQEPAFDSLADLARKLVGTSIGAVTIINGEKLWFKASVGVDFVEIPYEHSLCSLLLEDLSQPLVIEDTHLDARLDGNPIIYGPPYLRAYLGVALLSPEGIPIGALCAIDTVPRTFTGREIAAIQQLALQASGQLELRRSTRELDRAKNDAQVASRAKSIFLANVSHELRTPMNGVLGLIELLKLTPLTDTQAQFVEGIDASATNLNRVFTDILEYSDLVADRAEMNVIPHDVNELVDVVDQLCKAAVRHKGLRYLSNVSHQVDRPVYADRVKLKQILLQLIQNATKFTLEGSVELHVKLVDGKVRFQVRDTGIGIPHHMQEIILSPFTQVHDEANRVYPGKGLGLSTVCELLRLMGSELKIDSAEGRGSTFWFDLAIAS